MNINQSDSSRASKRQKYENNLVSAPTVQVAGVVYSEKDKEKKLIELIKGNDIFTPQQFDRLVQHKNTKIICKLIKHRGHLLQEHHIDTLIVRNNDNVDSKLLANKEIKMSGIQKDTIINRVMNQPIIDFISH